jgi:hypothetical protein
MSGRKPPPLLLGGALLFWGWQSGFVGIGAVLAILIEFPRWSKIRWDISIDEFIRIWVFTTLLLLASVVYAFTLNEGPSRFAELFQEPDLRTQTRAGLSTARTAAAMIRWLPMVFFLFVAAQQYSAKGGVPMETISLILRRRWKRAKKEGKPTPPTKFVDVSYVYFILCLFSSSIHSDESRGFFWGAGLLLFWALIPFKSPRFRFPAWTACVVAVLAMAWGGQKSLGRLQQYLETLNPQWLTSFHGGKSEGTRSKTALGSIGRIQTSPKIMVRLQAKDGPPPPYLREASYNVYSRGVWRIPDSTREFERVDEEPPLSSSFPLVPGKTNIANVEIACFLTQGEGLLPLPAGSGRLTNLPAFLLEKNPFGAVRASGPGLVIFDALFGPGETMESPPTEFDRDVPEFERWALDRVIDELDLRNKPKEEVLRSIQGFFGKFEYSLWQDRRGSRSFEMTPTARFLLESRKGHCEYFATATVLLLHRLGIDARYVVGYVVHEEAGERKYVVRQRDAHAWTLVWDQDRKVWRDFDTTPASWIQVESSPSWRQKLSDAWSRLVFEFLRIRWGQTRLREYILWVVIPILLVLLGQILLTLRKKVKPTATKAVERKAWPGLDSEFYELEKRLAKKGYVRQPQESAGQWLMRAVESTPGLNKTEQSAKEVLRLHYKYRFDPEGLTGEERERLRQGAQQLVTEVSALQEKDG